MKAKNTVVFDLDGTLLDTLDDLTCATRHTLKELGFPTRTREEVRSFVGNGIAVLLQKSLPAEVDEETFDKAMAIFKTYYGAHCNDQTGPYPGINELIDALLERNVKMAIVSNKADFATKELSEIYFDGRIPVAIGEKESEEIRKKPAPDTVYKSLELLCSTVEDAVYVGDSEVDIATARNADMNLVLCSWGFRDIEFLKEQGADVIINRPEELLSVIGLE